MGLACPACAQPGPWDSLTGGTALHADHTFGIAADLTGVEGPNPHCHFHRGTSHGSRYSHPPQLKDRNTRGCQSGWQDPDIASQLLPGTSLSTPPSPATQALKYPVPSSLAFLPNVTLLRNSQRYSCLSPKPYPSSQGYELSPQSYLSCWPQTRGAVSVLAATGPRRGSPILHLGPGHTSWGCGGNPGCGGRVVRRHLWLQKSVWGSKVGGQGMGGTVRKIRMAVPPEWPNAM